MNTIGIDPGSAGGIALLIDDRLDRFTYLSTDERMLEWLVDLQLDIQRAGTESDTIVIIEDVHAIGGSSAKGTFNFGFNVGEIHGTMKWLRYPIYTVQPKEWKKYFGLTNIKQESIDKAHEHYGPIDMKTSTRCKFESDGIAEAILIAHYVFHEKKFRQ